MCCPSTYPRSRIPSLKAAERCPAPVPVPTWRIPTLGIFPPDCAIAGSGTTSIPMVSVTISARTARLMLPPGGRRLPEKQSCRRTGNPEPRSCSRCVIRGRDTGSTFWAISQVAERPGAERAALGACDVDPRAGAGPLKRLVSQGHWPTSGTQAPADLPSEDAWRSRCDAALPRPPLWWDSSKASGTGLRVSDGNGASSDDEAGRHASPYDDLLPTRRCRYATKPVFAAILEDERDRTGQALQRRRLRLALAVRPRDLRAVGDIPGCRFLTNAVNSFA